MTYRISAFLAPGTTNQGSVNFRVTDIINSLAGRFFAIVPNECVALLPKNADLDNISVFNEHLPQIVIWKIQRLEFRWNKIKIKILPLVFPPTPPTYTVQFVGLAWAIISSMVKFPERKNRLILKANRWFGFYGRPSPVSYLRRVLALHNSVQAYLVFLWPNSSV